MELEKKNLKRERNIFVRVNNNFFKAVIKRGMKNWGGSRNVHGLLCIFVLFEQV